MFDQMKRVLTKEEQDLVDQQKQFVISDAQLKSQELRLKFFQQKNQTLNMQNRNAIKEYIKF